MSFRISLIGRTSRQRRTEIDMNEARGARRRRSAVGVSACVVALVMGLAWRQAAAQTDPAAGKVVGDKPAATQSSGQSSAQAAQNTAPASKESDSAKDAAAGKAVGD